MPHASNQWLFTATIIDCVDGDTFDVTIDLGFGISIKERVRVAGLNTPETRTRDLDEKRRGAEAKARAMQLLPVGSTVKAETIKTGTEKFGRYLAVIHLPDGRIYSEVMISEGHGVEYHGEAR